MEWYGHDVWMVTQHPLSSIISLEILPALSLCYIELTAPSPSLQSLQSLSVCQSVSRLIDPAGDAETDTEPKKKQKKKDQKKE